MKSSQDALNTLTDILEQLNGNAVNLKKQPLILGPTLTYDRKQECFTGPNAENANRYIRCSYREPFVIRETV